VVPADRGARPTPRRGPVHVMTEPVTYGRALFEHLLAGNRLRMSRSVLFDAPN
jgi:hypothetical protein